MPELPEVETVRRGLDQATRGLRVDVVTWLDGRMVRGALDADAVSARLAGQDIAGALRHGKFLVWRFQSGAGLLLHLGMTGRLRVGVPPDEPRLPHTHLILGLSDGTEVRLRDPRRFGRIQWLEAREPIHRGLGPDALSAAFTRKLLGARLSGRQASIKPLLLDQRLVAGIGNIYADEALFRAGIHPLRPGGSLTREEIRRLHFMVRRVLRESLAHRGTTFLSYEDTAGRSGDFLARLLVYGRAGDPCRRCGALIQSLVIGGRTTAFCERCQPRPLGSTPQPRGHTPPTEDP